MVGREKIVEYKLVSYSPREEDKFQKEINKLLKNGWALHGTNILDFKTGKWYQGMIKLETTKDPFVIENYVLDDNSIIL